MILESCVACMFTWPLLRMLCDCLSCLRHAHTYTQLTGAFWQMQVVAEVYAAQNVVVKPQILLSLVLYKIVDPAQVGQHQ